MPLTAAGSVPAVPASPGLAHGYLWPGTQLCELAGVSSRGEEGFQRVLRRVVTVILNADVVPVVKERLMVR